MSNQPRVNEPQPVFEDDPRIGSILDQVNGVAEYTRPDAIRGMPAFRRALRIASSRAKLLELVTPEITQRVFAPLMNTPHGFATDRVPPKSEPYDLNTIRTCLVDAFLYGALPINQELAIIAGRCYLAKNYFLRAIPEWPGVTNFSFTEGVPCTRGDGQNGMVVPFVVTLTLDGVAREWRFVKTAEFDSRIPVRVNDGMIVDAMIGKATRKALARVLREISGVVLPDGDAAEAATDRIGASRERAMIDPAAIAASASPNRGHGQDGLDRVAQAPADAPKPVQQPKQEREPEYVDADGEILAGDGNATPESNPVDQVPMPDQPPASPPRRRSLAERVAELNAPPAAVPPVQANSIPPPRRSMMDADPATKAAQDRAFGLNANRRGTRT